MSDIEIRRATIYNTETNYKELLQPPGLQKSIFYELKQIVKS